MKIRIVEEFDKYYNTRTYLIEKLSFLGWKEIDHSLNKDRAYEIVEEIKSGKKDKNGKLILKKSVIAEFDI